MGERRGTKGLELWCRKMTEGYPGVKIENMTTSWRDGLGFCAIIHHFRPDLIDFSKLNKDDIYHNNELAFSVAEQHLGIPALLEPEDMVEYPVPDRLSILTYLSQFYQAFVVSQGSPSRIVPKRTTTPSERGIVSPASTSPPTKVSVRSAGSVRREPCAKCNQPVFIAERLNVGKQLFHRTCFRCARCGSQLTLANYYETEGSEFCCETCPDEEVVKQTENAEDKLVLTRSLSDEEKSASLKNTGKDDYSAMFETALENSLDANLSKSYTLSSSQGFEFTQAQSRFIHSQISSDSDSGNEEPPELPASKPPDLEDLDKHVKSTNFEDLRSKECDNNDSVSECDNNDSGFPVKKQSSVNSVSDSVSDQLKTASTKLEKTHNFVTKETEESEDITTTSLVKARMRLFEQSSSKIEEDKSVSSIIVPSLNENSPTSLGSRPEVSISVDTGAETNTTKDENTDVKEEEPSETIEDSIDETEKSHITVLDSMEEKLIAEDSLGKSEENIIVISDSSADNSKVIKDDKDYPGELNPFGDDDALEETPQSKKSSESSKQYNSSLNPFGSDDDEEEDIKASPKPSPKPRTKKKIKPLLEDGVLNTTSGVYVKRESYNPFEDDDDDNDDHVQVASAKKVIPTPKISLTPIWDDNEEVSDDDSRRKPVPLPRTSKICDTPEPKPRHLSISMSTSNFGSTSSLARKKKQAPKPPGDSPLSSLTSSPSHSVQHSPGSTVRIRKTKRAPLPPTSTPLVSNQAHVNVDVSPVITVEEISLEHQKITKDEENRNRQIQKNHPLTSSSSVENYNLSGPDKSTYGKWKKRKGPAPSRPVPQKRTIKALPMNEIRRELDLIEIQQQGLERQGVRLEQIIRERFEGSNAEIDASSNAEVEDMILQLFELVNEKNELFRKQAELMYLRRQQRLEEEYAEVEYQIRCLMLQPEANKTDSDKAKEEELINRLVDIVERRNEIIECLEMDRIREAEEDDSINSHLNMYTLKRDEEKAPSADSSAHKKDKKKHKKEKKFKLKSHKVVDMDKDIDESEATSTLSPSKSKEKKKKKFNIF